VLNEIRNGNHGIALDATSFGNIQSHVTSEILKQIRKNMVDPDSTKIMRVQTENFQKCVARSTRVRATESSPKGYCVTFTYNSRNRMGGYGGEQAAFAFVRPENNGVVVLAALNAIKDANNYSYPYTPESGVYEFILVGE
jgi:hypothetical protein